LPATQGLVYDAQAGLRRTFKPVAFLWRTFFFLYKVISEMSLQRQSAVLVEASTGALCTKEGFKLIAATLPSNDPVITFSDGSTQITAPANARAADFTWSVAAPAPAQQTLAGGFLVDGTIGSIPRGSASACVGGNIYQLEMTVTLGGAGQSYVNNEAITQEIFAELENSSGSFVEPAPTVIIGPATVTRSLQDAQTAGSGNGTLTVFVNATVDLSAIDSQYVYDQLTVKASAYSNINTSTSIVQVEIDTCKWWSVARG
jgi:hypothetical protein